MSGCNGPVRLGPRLRELGFGEWRHAAPHLLEEVEQRTTRGGERFRG